MHQRLTETKITHEVIIEGQLSKFTFTLNDRKYNLIILYGPSEKDDHKFFSRDLFNYGMLPATDYNIIVGDYNAVQDLYLDCRNYTTHTTPKSTKIINDAKIKHNLVNPFRERNYLRKIFSWQRFNSDKHSRIDYFLISNNNFPHVKSTDYKVITHFITDHKQVNLQLVFNRIRKGKGYYKFDNALLSDKKFVFLSNRVIREHFVNNSIDPLNVDQDLDPTEFQFLEQKIDPTISSQSLITTLTGEAIKRSHDIRKERTILESVLESRINSQVHILENSEEKDTSEVLDTLSCLKAELAELRGDTYNRKTQDLKVSNLFNEEKPSKGFSNSIYRPRAQASYSQIYKERVGVEPILLTSQDEVETEISHCIS